MMSRTGLALDALLAAALAVGFRFAPLVLAHLAAVLLVLIEQGQLRLHHQPIVGAGDGKLRAAEALLRWPHPERGPIPPASFIGPAERSGLIRELTHWVLEAGLRQARAWQDAGISVPISLNLSMCNLLDPQLPTRWQVCSCVHESTPSS